MSHYKAESPKEKRKLPDFVWVIIGVSFSVSLFIACIGGIMFAFLKGVPWMEDNILPISQNLFWFNLMIFMPVALILVIPRELRMHAATALYCVTMLFGLTLWVWSFILVGKLLSIGWIVVGLLFAGVGVVPLAAIAAAIRGHWGIVWQIILIVGLLAAFRGWSLYLLDTVANRSELENIGDNQRRLNNAAWLILAAFWLPYIGWLTVVPFYVCSLILCFSTVPTVRRRGRKLLLVGTGMYLAVIVGGVTVGYFFPSLLTHFS